MSISDRAYRTLFALLLLWALVMFFVTRESRQRRRPSHAPRVARVHRTVLAFSGVPLGAYWIAVNLLRERDGSRRKNGQCIYCGYDLRASHGRCPECGERAPS